MQRRTFLHTAACIGACATLLSPATRLLAAAPARAQELRIGFLAPRTGIITQLGTDMVNADVYTITERRERGGIAEFEMVFVEAGQDVFSSPVVDTAAAAISSAQSAIQSFLSSSDIISL